MCLRNMKCIWLFLLVIVNSESRKLSIKNPSLMFQPCISNILKSSYNYGSYPMGEENQYLVGIHMTYAAGTVITMELDTDAIVELTLVSSKYAVVSASQKKNTFIIVYTKEYNMLEFTVKGLTEVVPYFNSMMINGREECQTPVVDYLNLIVKDAQSAVYIKSTLSDHDCGRRKIKFVELIVNGESTTPGDWPWHTAIYRFERANNNYICGGTLISKLFVLTAAHCASINGVPVTPDILTVILGKYHLIRDDTTSERREVASVKIHDDFGSPQRLDNDIALLKLKTEAVFTDYIQPACLWSNNAHLQSMNQIMGSVVGWGYSQINDVALSPELKQANLPVISDEKCIKSNTLFYGTMLQNEKKFCAGWGNGTSPCNGDSGSGFLVYVPDKSSGRTGAWYIRGITSMTLKTPGTTACDPTKYVVFTDTSKYADWIRIKTLKNVLQE